MALPAVIGIKNSLFLGRKSLFPILATLIQYSLYHFNIGIKTSSYLEEKAFIIYPCNRSTSLLPLVLSTKLLNSASFFTYLYPHIFYLHPIVYCKLASLSNKSSSYFQSQYTSGTSSIWYIWYPSYNLSSGV